MTVRNRDDVIAVLAACDAELQALGVRRIGLFGSFQRDTAHAKSDVDLLIEFERGRKSFRALNTAWDVLEAALGRPVELVTPEGLSPYVGPRILAEAGWRDDKSSR